MDSRTLRTALVVLVLCAAYAVLRYHVFGTVPWAIFFPFVLNKAVSLAGLTLMSMSYLTRNNPGAAKTFGVSGFALSCLHIVLSVPILGPGYYPKFFDGGRWVAAAELSMAAGLLSFLLFIPPAMSSPKEMQEGIARPQWKFLQRAGYWALAAAAAHVALMGYSGWLTPGKWQGFMPPITLLGVAAAVLPLARLLWRVRAGVQQPEAANRVR
jgi:DMSO/TMAO reductase YedYZ heme-binding membrane subunit